MDPKISIYIYDYYDCEVIYFNRYEIATQFPAKHQQQRTYVNVYSIKIIIYLKNGILDQQKLFPYIIAIYRLSLFTTLYTAFSLLCVRPHEKHISLFAEHIYARIFLIVSIVYIFLLLPTFPFSICRHRAVFRVFIDIIPRHYIPTKPFRILINKINWFSALYAHRLHPNILCKLNF